MKHLFIFSFLFLFFRKTFAQDLLLPSKINISGAIINAKTRLPVDSSVYVIITIEGDKSYRAYCNNFGKYSIYFPDTLKGRQVKITASQDDNKIKKYITSNIGAPCTFRCDDDNNLYMSSAETKKIIIKTDSIKNYIPDFWMTSMIIDYRCPEIYFKENEYQILKSDFYLTDDTSLCFFSSLLKCKKTWVFELQGHSDTKEKHRKKLSQARAEEVKNKLIAAGINPARLVISSYNDSYQIKTKEEIMKAPEKEREKLRKLNRRVAISLLSKDFGIETKKEDDEGE